VPAGAAACAPGAVCPSAPPAGLKPPNGPQQGLDAANDQLMCTQVGVCKHHPSPANGGSAADASAAESAKWKQVGHTALDAVSMIPVVSEFASGANAVWYASEGDWTNAGISAAGMIPVAGEGIVAARAASSGLKAVKGIEDARAGENLLKTGSELHAPEPAAPAAGTTPKQPDAVLAEGTQPAPPGRAPPDAAQPAGAAPGTGPPAGAPARAAAGDPAAPGGSARPASAGDPAPGALPAGGPVQGDGLPGRVIQRPGTPSAGRPGSPADPGAGVAPKRGPTARPDNQPAGPAGTAPGGRSSTRFGGNGEPEPELVPAGGGPKESAGTGAKQGPGDPAAPPAGPRPPTARAPEQAPGEGGSAPKAGEPEGPAGPVPPGPRAPQAPEQAPAPGGAGPKPGEPAEPAPAGARPPNEPAASGSGAPEQGPEGPGAPAGRKPANSPADGDPAAANAAPKKPLPPGVREQMEAGNEFNRQMRPNYPYNEIRLDNNKVMDSYRPGQEIVERKFTQLSDIQPETAQGYLNQLANQYPPGARIADTPANRASMPGLIGQPIRGRQFLEVPVQNKAVPEAVLQAADKLGIIIRDSNGKVYGP
jgi:hypothetical protein